ncbi:MAG: hypothetical protein HY722_14235, partial [Planctomycetes bacterium]|nr:hypothetical protein [Planctomycetota bacterium]
METRLPEGRLGPGRALAPFPSALVALLLLVAPGARAQTTGEPDPQVLEEAIRAGTGWLLARQGADGAWGGRYAEAYPGGPTALAVRALLATGQNPESAPVVGALARLRTFPLDRTYAVASMVLAITRRYAPPRRLLERTRRPYEVVARKTYDRLAHPRDRSHMDLCVRWLVEHQEGPGWRYPGSEVPGGPVQDAIHTCYALAALHEAALLGADVPPEVFQRALEGLLDGQQAEGDEVRRFPVPLADLPIAGSPAVGPAAGARPEAPDPAGERMHARGWGYVARAVPTVGPTTASLASLALCKERLEKGRDYGSALREQVGRALRDGAGWLATHLVETPPRRSAGDPGPGTERWRHADLELLERAATLLAVERLGDRDWWGEGAAWLLDHQEKDGAWDAAGDPVTSTAFALLFLSRPTRPLLG